MNWYTYVGNDPMSNNDPSGKFANFLVKFVADVAIGAALNYIETGEVNLGAAVVDAAVGLVNPAKTVQKAKRLAKVVSGKFKGKGKCCFVAGTQVLTQDGYKNIEDVVLGEKLWAKNTESGEQAWKPVTKIFNEPNRGIFEIKLKAADGFEQKIEATDDHPFYVIGKGWQSTVELVSGDRIETDGFGGMTVKSVDNENRQELTYNFTVADFHTYYVTKYNVLVHNCPTGSYVNTHKSNKTYDGKGDADRAAVSGKRVEKEFNDPLVKTETKTAKTERESFKQESESLDSNGGPGSDSNYNKIESPGKKYRKEDGEL